jgi:hypothetical protein
MHANVLKALEAVPIHWTDCGIAFHLVGPLKRTDGGPAWLRSSDNIDVRESFMSDREASALMEKHWREWLEQRGVKILTNFNGKMSPVPSYYVSKELTNEDGYWEGDGGEAWLCQGTFVPPPIPDGLWSSIFDSYLEAIASAVLAVEGKQ